MSDENPDECNCGFHGVDHRRCTQSCMCSGTNIPGNTRPDPLPSNDNPSLADLQRNYLRERGHTLSIDGKPLLTAVREQARYVRGEALEMQDAAEEWITVADGDYPTSSAAAEHLSDEIADVALSLVTLANLFGFTVEACIALKTKRDRDRG